MCLLPKFDQYSNVDILGDFLHMAKIKKKCLDSGNRLRLFMASRFFLLMMSTQGPLLYGKCSQFSQNSSFFFLNLIKETKQYPLKRNTMYPENIARIN